MIGFLFYPLSTTLRGKHIHHSLESEAIVQQVVHQGRLWRVDFAGTSWNARCEQQIALLPGDRVYVVSRDNITLIVEPA
jgi:membrane protein implicated in regulation of membrane protease activity